VGPGTSILTSLYWFFIDSYKYASEEIVDTALALAQAYATTGREEAESKCNIT
jgi:hypothetical protein